MTRTDWKYLVDALLFVTLGGVVLIGLLMGFALAEGPGGTEGKFFLGLHRHQWGGIHLILSLVFTGLLVIHLALAWSWIHGKSRQIFKARWKGALIAIAALSVAAVLAGWILSTKNDPAYRDYGTRSGRAWTEAGGGRDERARGEQNPASLVRVQPPAGQEGAARVEGEAAPPARAEEHAGEAEKAVAGRLSENDPDLVVTGQMTLRDIERASGIPAADIVRHLRLPVNAPLDEALGRLRRRYGFAVQDVRDYVAERLKKKASPHPPFPVRPQPDRGIPRAITEAGAFRCGPLGSAPERPQNLPFGEQPRPAP